MIRVTRILQSISFEQHTRALNSNGITTNRNILFNPTVPQLYQIAFLNEPPSDPFTRNTSVSSNGALCAYSGLKTTRQPLNSRIVKDRETEKTVNWSNLNIPISPENFEILEKTAVDYINHKGRCIVVDGYAGWDNTQRIKVRTYCTRSYHALFIRNMLIRPTQKEMDEDFSRGVDMHIFNAGEMAASKNLVGTNSITALDLHQKKLVIMGTQFAGEMKKSIFKIFNYYFPRKGILTMHSSAILNSNNTSTIMLGLSSTGKTALSLRSDSRKLIGDDEICWGNNGLFNIEGGVYAKITNLNKNVQPQIYNAIKFGSIVQNASFYPNSKNLNFNDISIASSARTAFPLSYLKNAQLPAIGPHPSNIILLTCDTKGVIPPVARLTNEQAIYYYLSGYSAKLTGSQMNLSKPQFTFSSCFGQIFLPLHPSIYAKILMEKITKHKPNIWIVNTGWTGGKIGIGKRINFTDSVKIIDAINNGSLNNLPTYNYKSFNFKVPQSCPGIDSELLRPQNGWNSKVQYDETLTSLAIDFIENYNKKFKGKLGEEFKGVAEAGPTI